MVASLKDVAQKMRNLDICTFTTTTKDKRLAGRPMSNNGDVEYDGNSWYFTYEKAHLVADIEADQHVQLAFQGEDELYVSVSGVAELTRDKSQFEEHWVDGLKQWFSDGTDTPGMVLVCVKADRVTWWQREESETYEA